MGSSFWDGFLGIDKDVPRLPSEQVWYDMGARASFRSRAPIR